jgi:hypothetical protein
MSRQVRHRVTAVLLGGLLLGAPLLANGTASAGRPTDPLGQRSQVTPTASVPAERSQAIPNSGMRPRTPVKRATRIKTRTSTGTRGSAPMLAGKPPPGRNGNARRVPTRVLPPPAEPALAAPTSRAPGIATEQVAAGSMSESGLIGLLAAVSIVLVMGVSAGVIRAIVSKRASRTKIA